MTFMEFLDRKKKLTEAIGLLEKKVNDESVDWDERRSIYIHELSDLRCELHELRMWEIETYYSLAIRESLYEAIMSGELTISPEVVALIEKKRKELVERTKQRLNANHEL